MLFRKHKQEIISRPLAAWLGFLRELQKGVSELKIEGISAQEVSSELSTKAGPVS